MIQSNVNLFGESTSIWDTSYARKFLRIPEEQLKMINEIKWTGFSTILDPGEHPQKVYTDKGIQIENMGNTPNCQISNYMEKEKLNPQKSSSRSIKNYEETKSDSQLQGKTYKINPGKSSLSRSASLCLFTHSDEPKDNFKLRSSNSAPHIYQSQITHKSLGSVDGKLSLNEIAEVPRDVLINHTDLIYTTRESKENLQIQKHDKLSSKILKSDLKLGESILNHRYFKKSVKIAVGNSNIEKSSPITTNLDENIHNPLLNKRLMLLEKRFSPSKEFCSLPSEDRGQKLLEANFSASEDKDQLPIKNDKLLSPRAVRDNSSQHLMYSEQVQNITLNMPASAPKYGIDKDLDAKLDNSSINCVSQTSKNEKDLTYEETFGSQPLPCGQPLPLVENPSSHNNSLNITITKTITSVDSNQVKVLKKISNNVISENNIEQMKEPYLTSSNTHRIMCKRKRKSKDDVHKKLPHSKNSRKVNIHFTSDQISNMLDIMKMFQLKN